MNVKRFVNYKRLCIFISQLAHDYDSLGFKKFMAKNYKCSGIYSRYLSGYRSYLISKETGVINQDAQYTGKFILEPYLHEEYFKFKNKSIIDSISNKIVPELYRYGFIFTSVQESVQSFVKEGNYEKGF